MSTQPQALRLADALKREWGNDALNYDTALDAQIELRRLHAANLDCVEHFNAVKAERDELLAALKSARWRIANLVGPVGAQGLDREALTKIDAAIAKAEA